ncbi:MAG TPA: type II toxin-antitoxin system RelE/ParE family toxin [Steroidobacteraceae bacterium]
MVEDRPLHWVGAAKRDLLSMPRPVVREIGIALRVAQRGGRHPRAKPWRGDGPGVLELVCNLEGNAFRSVYTVHFKRAIYVLHCFQKKSPTGILTARPDVELITKRLRAAHQDYGARYGRNTK